MGGKLFHTRGPAAAKVLSLKQLHIRLTTSIRVDTAWLSGSTVGDEFTV